MSIKPPLWLSCCLMIAAVALLMAKRGVTQEPSHSAAKASAESSSVEPGNAARLISVDEARERARILHDVYEATLRTIHSRYFKENSGVPIPSRAMEEVFSRVTRRTKVKARWIAVNSQAMDLDHEPADDFEKAAVRVLSAGGQEFEQVENGMYRRATPIALLDSCLKCHAPPPIRVTNARFAGLVIAMPVK